MKAQISLEIMLSMGIAMLISFAMLTYITSCYSSFGAELNLLRHTSCASSEYLNVMSSGCKYCMIKNVIECKN